MRFLYGIFFLIFIGQSVQAANINTVAKDDICTTCNCNVKDKIINCKLTNLFKLFDKSAWDAVITRNNSIVLDTVDFADNGISVVTTFPKLDIRTLNFTRNKIQKIEYKAFQNLTMLEKLDLSENNLTKEAQTKEVFEGLYSASSYEPLNLKWLNLANNEIHSLDLDTFDHLPKLEVLYLQHNTFKVIDPTTASAISTINSLQVLDLSYAELRDLPTLMLHGPRRLKTLILSGNLFNRLPEAIHYATNLVELNLDDNTMEQIGGSNNSFPSLPKLELLSISYMRDLKTIDEGAFHHLTALRYFNCRYNTHLSSIHPQAFGDVYNKNHTEWPPIQNLILFNNNLSTISQKLLDRWDEIEEIDIRYNPWACTCENQWIVDKLVPLIKEKNKDTPIYLDDVRCDHPSPMAGKSFLEIQQKNENMRCDDYYGRRPERDGPILVGIFIGLLIGIPITMFALWAYRRGCFGLFGYRPSPADYGRAFYKRTELREDLHM